MKAVFTQDFGNKKKGMVVEIDPFHFKALKEEGVVELYKQGKIEAPKTELVIKTEVKQAKKPVKKTANKKKK